MRRTKLVTRFALVSVVAFTLLGVGLVWSSQRILEKQAKADAVQTAEAYAALLPAKDLVLPTGAPRRNERVDLSDPKAITVSPALLRPPVVDVRLWTKQTKQLLASSGPEVFAPGDLTLYGAATEGQAGGGLVRQITPGCSSDGTTGVPGPGASARPGCEITETLAGQREQRVLDAFVPVRLGDQAKPTAVVEVLLDYTDTERRLTEALRTTVAVVALGLLLAWLLLFRTVLSASRTLRRQASENARLALLDPLTMLPNRRLFTDRLERAVTATARTGGGVGVVLLDVDRFKEVNDSLGHPVGDELLLQVADRLSRTVRDSDTVARLGGDEFAVLLPDVTSIGDAEALARRVQRVFDDPFTLAGDPYHCDTSIGLAVLPQHADDHEKLFKNADVAMYMAKQGRLGLAVYSAEADANSPVRLRVLSDLRVALDTDDQLFLHYQPKVDLRSGKVVGLEALLRWRHPTRGLVPPFEFIPAAEQTGLIHGVTERVLELVASQLATWREEGFELPVAVNLSARNLVEPELDLQVEQLLQRHALPPHLLEFEVTESAIVEDPERALDMLRRLNALGVTVAVDDFGIGSTSMSQLKHMPLSTLKIDRSFVTSLGEDASGTVFVKAMVDLAHAFGLLAVAEGVEDDEAIERLREVGCDAGQGYLWSRPVPPEELPEVLARLAKTPPVVSRM